MDTVESRCVLWNKGKLPGQKPPLKPKEIRAIRIRLKRGHRLRDHDVVQGSRVAARAIALQKQTQ